MYTGYSTLQLETEDTGLTRLTLSRPACLNAISFEMIEELHHVFDQLASDTTQRVIILSGQGRGFCSGTDLRSDFDSWPEGNGRIQSRTRMQERLSQVPLKMRELPQPIIAAVHGPATGGGMAFAAASDIRIVDQTARFNAAFVRIGLSAGDVGASWTLPRLIGLSRAAELLYTGRFFDAQEAYEIGFASSVVDAGMHIEAAERAAESILANSPMGIRMTKSLLALTLDAPSIRTHMELENRSQVLGTLTDDFREGVAAFAERRQATFRDA